MFRLKITGRDIRLFFGNLVYEDNNLSKQIESLVLRLKITNTHFVTVNFESERIYEELWFRLGHVSLHLLGRHKVENLGILPYHQFTGKTIGKNNLPVKKLVKLSLLKSNKIFRVLKWTWLWRILNDLLCHLCYLSSGSNEILLFFSCHWWQNLAKKWVK